MMTPHAILQRIFAESGVLKPPLPGTYGQKFGKYLTVGVDQIASPDTGEVTLLPAIVELFTETREILGRPQPVTAGFRSHAHETALQAAGYRTAKLLSPHSVACALDLDAIPTAAKTEAAVNVAIRTAVAQAAVKLKLPAPRLGFKAYGERFTHVDVVFLLFEPYTKLPHPQTWPELEPAQRALFAAWQPGVSW